MTIDVDLGRKATKKNKMKRGNHPEIIENLLQDVKLKKKLEKDIL